MAKLLFLHGFMGSPADGDFLKSIPEMEIITLEVPHSPSIDLPSLYQQIDDHNPDFIYGYSLGGRIALDYLNKSKKSIKLLILESVNLGIQSEEARQVRLAQDKKHAENIKHDFSLFLKHWYQQKMWGNLSPSQQNQLIEEKKMNWQNNLESLSQTITFYSTGKWPCFNLNQLTNKTLYLCGADDLKYKKIAKSLNDIEVMIFEYCGHNIHFQNPVALLERITPLLSSLPSSF